LVIAPYASWSRRNTLRLSQFLVYQTEELKLLKKILFMLLIGTTFQAHAGTDIKGTDLIEICQESKSICVLIYTATVSGATNGHMLIENYRTHNNVKKMYDYFCWDKSNEISYGQNLELFLNTLSKQPKSMQDMPLGSLVVKFLHDQYPTC